MVKDGQLSAAVNKSLKEIESYMSVFWVLRVQIYYKSFNPSFFEVLFCISSGPNSFRNSFMKMEAV